MIRRGIPALRKLPLELISFTTASVSVRSLSTSPNPIPASRSPKHFYATTPIFYVNAAPHIGHLHSTLLADIYTRAAGLKNPEGPRPILCTGTDEHGLKIQRVAEGQGISPRVLCDTVSERFRDLAKAGNIDYSVFVRTTEERHRAAVEHFWRELMARGYIYKSSYVGWYAVSDEAYYTESQVTKLEDSATGVPQMISTETKASVEWMEEETYKFKLSAFREPLVEWLSTSNVVQPPSRSTALLTALLNPSSSDLQDLSISRPSARLSWGIPVPDDPDHTIYVWVDALINYLTAAGYPWKGGEAFKEGDVWPPELMVIGKDIIRFHALYLPALLMALKLPLPQTILTHGHWTMDKTKMSKSRGNVADPIEAMEKWGTDVIRAYLMHAGGNSGVDADYSPVGIERFYTKRLRGTLGNLLARVSAPLISRLPTPAAIHTSPSVVRPVDEAIHAQLTQFRSTFITFMDAYEIRQALGATFDLLDSANQHMAQQEPWKKDASPDVVHSSLYYITEALRLAGIALQPFMPLKSAQLLDELGVLNDKRSWRDLSFGHGGERIVSQGARDQLFPQMKK